MEDEEDESGKGSAPDEDSDRGEEEVSEFRQIAIDQHKSFGLVWGRAGSDHSLGKELASSQWGVWEAELGIAKESEIS